MALFSSLIQDIPGIYHPFGVDPLIKGINLDSRQVSEGCIFVALRGTQVDGHIYIPDAVQRGAAAVITERSFPELKVPHLEVNDARSALASLSAAFYDFPARKLTMIGVTGTDGKTTTANYIFSILKAADIKAGMITTVNALIGDQILDTGFHVTTPEAPDVQRYLAQMVEAGLTHVVLETTSHGLEQQRVGACDFDLGVVTNITHEHLDYHGSYDAYLAAKGRLFTSLAVTPDKPCGNFRIAVLNLDDRSYPHLKSILPDAIRTISYGLDPQAVLYARDIEHSPSGISFTAFGPDFEVHVDTQLLGDYNVYNILAALGISITGLGIDADVAALGIAALAGIPGRMEAINLGQNFLAVVDFAHTPNALKRALEAARLMTAGQVIAVFGSAGLRDREKRRLMAEVSVEMADITVLTAEDPRTEPLDAILSEMAVEAESKGGIENHNFWRVSDRGDAIRFALRQANPGDIVMVCGKGHEQSMCFGDVEYPWDDRIATQAALCEYLDIPGPEMLLLPTSTSDN